MPNIKQQKKRVGVAARQRLENLRYRSSIKTLFNRLGDQVDAKDTAGAEATHRELVSLIDKAVKRGALHANTAARKKARAARELVREPRAETKVTRKPKKQRPGKKAAPAAKKDSGATKDDEPAATKPAAKKAATKKAAAKKPAATEAADAPEPADAPADEAAAPAADADAAPTAEAADEAATEATADEAGDKE